MPKPKRKPLAERQAAGPTTLSTEEVANRYNLTEWGVRRLVRAKKLTAINIGTDRRRILRFREADLAKYEKQSAA